MKNKKDTNHVISMKFKTCKKNYILLLKKYAHILPE